MRATALMMMCAAALSACGGDRQQAGTDDREQTSTTGGATGAQPGTATDTGGGTTSATPTGATANGQQVYGRTCVTCHQANGRGMPNAFPPLAGSTYATGDKGRLIRMTLNGLTGQWTASTGGRFNGVMPPWKAQLNDAEVAAVLTYVRSSFGNSASAVTAEEVARERAATASKATPYTQAEIGNQ